MQNGIWCFIYSETSLNGHIPFRKHLVKLDTSAIRLIACNTFCSSEMRTPPQKSLPIVRSSVSPTRLLLMDCIVALLIASRLPSFFTSVYTLYSSENVALLPLYKLASLPGHAAVAPMMSTLERFHCILVAGKRYTNVSLTQSQHEDLGIRLTSWVHCNHRCNEPDVSSRMVCCRI